MVWFLSVLFIVLLFLVMGVLERQQVHDSTPDSDHQEPQESPAEGAHAAAESTDRTADTAVSAAGSPAKREDEQIFEPEAMLESYDDLPDSFLVRPGPQVQTIVGAVPLTDWLRHLRGDDAWAQVVKEFYDRAAADPMVASYFADTDMPTLRRHFLAALKIVGSDGVTVGVLRAMQRAHAPVTDEQDKPIDLDIWNAVIGALGETLAEWEVPTETIGQLVYAVEPLKGVIVRGPAHAH